MASRQCTLILYNIKPRNLHFNRQYFNPVSYLLIYRTVASPSKLNKFSTSSQLSKCQKTSKDQPYAYSKSKAKFHTVDDTLGISKSKKSNTPLYLGLGLFCIIIYFGFVRKESNSSPESLEELLDRIRILHNEKELKNQTVDENSSNSEVK